MKYAWTDDRSTYPVLVVGRSYRHRRYGQIRIERRSSSCICYDRGGTSCSCRQAYMYVYSVDGEVVGEQNDFALLNQLRDVPGVARQLALL